MTRVIFSFVLDANPQITYQGYHLARSILQHCGGDAGAIHVHVTPDVSADTRAAFLDLGCRVVEIARSSDGGSDLAVLLDPDTILTADIRPHLRTNAGQGTITELLPSNLIYDMQSADEHRHDPADIPICLLHYRDALNVLGVIQPPQPLTKAAADAVAIANAQIARGFDNRVFWNFRYAEHPERGSGIGSRGEALEYKRALLKSEGLESAASVLDIGCGDLEVLHPFALGRYLGLDVSQMAIAIASARRPDWSFRLLSADMESIPEAEFVLCLEVLIHQTNIESYLRVIELAAAKTLRKLIVSGYKHDAAHVGTNHMIHYYEPLAVSLARTKRFRTIEEIGGHTDVTIYRCCV